MYTVTTKNIKAIISQKELIKLFENNELNEYKDTVLISITNPLEEYINPKIKEYFFETLETKFWDITEEAKENIPALKKSKYEVITDEQAKEIKEFILKHKEKTFFIHCSAGISRSAGVGESIHFLLNDYKSKYEYCLDGNPISSHPRYKPNLTVRDKIIEC